MLKIIYNKINNDDIQIRIDDIKCFKDNMKFIVPGSKIKWIGEKKKYKCVARSDNFIIVTKPFNLKPETCLYSIFDLSRMKCNRDNLIFGLYDYSKVEDCNEALRRLENSLYGHKEKTVTLPDGTPIKISDVLEISERGITDIENVIEEIWIEVSNE